MTSHSSLRVTSHQSALTAVDEACLSLGLEIRPDKCISFCYDNANGKPLPQITSQITFSLTNGNTRNIASGPTKFLGETIGLTSGGVGKTGTGTGHGTGTLLVKPGQGLGHYRGKPGSRFIFDIVYSIHWAGHYFFYQVYA